MWTPQPLFISVFCASGDDHVLVGVLVLVLAPLEEGPAALEQSPTAHIFPWCAYLDLHSCASCVAVVRRLRQIIVDVGGLGSLTLRKPMTLVILGGFVTSWHLASATSMSVVFRTLRLLG